MYDETVSKNHFLAVPCLLFILALIEFVVLILNCLLFPVNYWYVCCQQHASKCHPRDNEHARSNEDIRRNRNKTEWICTWKKQLLDIFWLIFVRLFHQFVSFHCLILVCLYWHTPAELCSLFDRINSKQPATRTKLRATHAISNIMTAKTTTTTTPTTEYIHQKLYCCV